MSTGASKYKTKGDLKQRHLKNDSDVEWEDIISKTSTLNLEEEKNRSKSGSRKVSEGLSGDVPGYGVFISAISPILLTLVSAYVRLYNIDKSNSVMWDEAHFGKFGSHYLQHEFYFDVHPPLGKLLVALSGWLTGYDGSFLFDSGLPYPEDCNFVAMRCFNAIFGILCTPIAYYTALSCGFNPYTVWLITLCVTFEMLAMTLAKFILLDSMLLFFTVLCFYCLAEVHRLRAKDELLTKKGILWLVISGVSVGCVCSVKWVGLFITVVVGLYTVYDLYVKYCQVISVGHRHQLPLGVYLLHWISRVATLIVIPTCIYFACFKVHFLMLTKSGSGDGSVSTLLQASFDGNTLTNGPRSIAFGSLVTLRSHGLSPNLLHSHGHNYPEGSQQQQITTYGYKDVNNEWLIEYPSEAGVLATEDPGTVDPGTDFSYLRRHLVDGDTIRLLHKETDALLHSHPIQAFVTNGNYEVSCYANLDNSDYKDEWVIEIEQQQDSPDPYFKDENNDEIHPISTNFRLRHKDLGCYLATTGYQYPSWGFGQGETVCKYSYVPNDKTTWWNVEDHINDLLPAPQRNYTAPKPKFWKEFVMLNYAMMSSNNALIPDKDKFDRLSSEWWQWPIAQIGLRMGSWSMSDIKYFLVSHPVITWASTASLGLFLAYSFILLLLWQRQVINLPHGIFDPAWDKFLIQAIIPFLAWFFNYYPFIIMGRVTYVHHYVPAQYFAIFVLGFMFEQITNKLPKVIKLILYFSFYGAIIYVFYYLRELSLGMQGPSHIFSHLKVLDSWMI